MEKEIIRFKKSRLPIMLYHLSMREGRVYRGMHSHKAMEIVAVKGGILHVEVNDTTMKGNPGQVIFINGDIGHRLYSDNAEILYLHIDVSLLGEHDTNDSEFAMLHAFVSHTQNKPYLIANDNKEVLELIHKINAKYHDDAKDSYWYLKAYLYELVAFLYSQGFIMNVTVSKEQIKRIEQVVRFVDANYKLPITLEDICSAAKYSKYSICHTFKSVTGATIFEYINFIRVHYAVEKLKDPQNTILEIATECGFSSATYFNRVFKNFFGCSPSVYRKHLSENIVNEWVLA